MSEKKTKKQKSIQRQIIAIIILAVIFVLLLNPTWIPFISADTKAVITAQMQSVFGRLAGGHGGSVFTLPTLMSVAGICIMCYLISKIITLVLGHFAKTANRNRTICELLISLVKFLTGAGAIIWSLSAMGVDMTTLFASIGILSLIIGFGAQSLIEDTITGIFIIAEGQYNIGDIIILDDFRGVVRKIGMRTTVIEDDGGNMEIINNSDIRNMQNRSNNLSLAVADVGTPYESKVEDMEKILIPELQHMFERNSEIFAKVPVYAGVQDLGDSAVVLRFWVECEEGKIFKARRALNREIKNCLDRNGISIPYQQVVIHNAKD